MSKRPEEKKEEIVYPSPYGSHKSMVDEAETAKFISNEKNIGVLSPDIPLSEQVVLKDAAGFYATTLKRLDNGLADTNRYDLSRSSRNPWPKEEKKKEEKKEGKKDEKK